MRKQFLFLLLLWGIQVTAQDDISYQQPPREIYDLVMAQPSPGVTFDAKGEWMILMEKSSFPTIEDMAQPELKIAGMRMNPRNFGPSRSSYYVNLKIRNIKTGETFAVEGLPADLKATDIEWNPSESAFAFIHSGYDRIDLYQVALSDKKARKINRAALNNIMGAPYQWMNDQELIYKTVPANYRPYPPKPLAPKGPNVQENLGKKAASRTYQDLIHTPYDEDLFDYMATCQLVKNNGEAETPIGSPAIYRSFSLSPNNQYLLLQTIRRPFSYLVPAYGFPHDVWIANLQGDKVKMLASNPSTEGQPIGFDDSYTFPRNFDWRDDEPASVTYVQAIDKGLGRSAVEYHDALMQVNADPDSQPKVLLKTKRRLRRVIWGNKDLALVYQASNYDRMTQLFRFNPSTGVLNLLNERSSNDEYHDLGTPVLTKNELGRSVLSEWQKDKILLRAQGASPEGDMPLLQSFDLASKKTAILWQCQAPYYEYVVEIPDPKNLVIITSKESISEPPNYYIRNLKRRIAPIAITDFKNPYPQLEGISKEKISYNREDGINLTGNLYLPKGYDRSKDGPLPVLMWAYPREYKSAVAAAQVRGSKYTFTRLYYGSPIFWVTRGYAVLDNAEMPIVGEGKKEPNDNFIPQLYMNAHAAIEALAKLGVGDSNRVAVGGHSYGAFMTANLLAHTKLFKAGIARSGAYNRTLTPFGFQAEERTYWQAPQVYYNMSPFSFANEIKTPILLIHGEMDNNPGTFPIQSERLYNAIKGHGGTARLVYLPYEAHGYAAKENILHMLWEQDQWLDKFVKHANSNKENGNKKSF